MRTARFLSLVLFLGSMTCFIGCGGEVTSPDETMTETEDPAITDDSTMIETGDSTGDVLTE